MKMDTFTKAKSRAYARLEETRQRDMERTVWIGIVLVALFAGILIGGIIKTQPPLNSKGNEYYTVGMYYSPDTIEVSNGNLFCVTGMEINPFSRYLVKLYDNGTETVIDDEIVEITEIWD